YTYGHMTNGWWYSVAVLPTTIIAACTYLLMLFALRRATRLAAMFFWMVIASVPLILVLPSFYASRFFFVTFGRLCIGRPGTLQGVCNKNTLEMGSGRQQLATLGIIGASLAVMVIFVSLMLGGYAPPAALQAIHNISQSITRAMTRAFGERRPGK